ncbi:hypothetical protein Ga0061062_110133 [Comamonas thiooxydans]|uniref:Uncharacterized protein n=1 Tax=Comamonas thiooxydans TaxID=363952 RepID=A0A0E3BQ59_9BURK|nr:hypothetical protein [Comamonas thiooxydans]KGG97830.1 hypothetical protein P245_04525 [Comamonas thiooxydans]CUB00743.1 hypothetical protein Ga0061062_110133 [Comamonas thiooxydans]
MARASLTSLNMTMVILVNRACSISARRAGGEHCSVRCGARGVRITDLPLLPRLDSCELARGMLKTIHPQPPAQTPSPGLSQARPQPCQSHFSRSARNHPGMKKASIAEAFFAHVGSAETAAGEAVIALPASLSRKIRRSS